MSKSSIADLIKTVEIHVQANLKGILATLKMKGAN